MRHRRAVLAALLAASTAVGPLALREAKAEQGTACSWDMYQHDATHSGAAGCDGLSTSNIASLAPRWFFPTAGTVTATPTVADGTVFVGDGNGTLYALDANAQAPTLKWSTVLAPSPSAPPVSNPMQAPGGPVKDDNTGKVDQHQVSYSEIASSAAYGRPAVTGLPYPVVYVGAGGSVYAIWAGGPKAGQPVWAIDLDPAQPTSPEEVESSPVLYQPPSGAAEVIVGDDVNESAGTDQTGLVALDAGTGDVIWKYEPETDHVVRSLVPSGEDPSLSGHGCGDIWSSPAVDAAHELVYFGTGNCDDPQGVQGSTGPDARPVPNQYARSEAIWALDARTGQRQWAFNETSLPDLATYNFDDDFGSSPALEDLTLDGKAVPVLIEGSKAGFVFALDRLNGKLLWHTQAAQPGQTGPNFAGAIGGFIGSGALGAAGSKPAWFAASAIPAPLGGDGITSSGFSVDPTLQKDPQRVSSLHAVNLIDGTVIWHAPVATASYASVTYDHGVVFAPSTTSFDIEAFDAATGRLLWAAPTAAAMSSGVAVVGQDIFFGGATYLSSSMPLPPQAAGVWSFGAAAPSS